MVKNWSGPSFLADQVESSIDIDCLHQQWLAIETKDDLIKFRNTLSEYIEEDDRATGRHDYYGPIPGLPPLQSWDRETRLFWCHVHQDWEEADV